jgi:tRNA dimethylallyltransferase
VGSATRVLILTGPTAAGKTQLAIELANQFGAALVSADAMTVYRQMDIGTAKPSPDLLADHPHACIDVRDVPAEFSVADFVRAVDRVCAANDRVIIVGGTPFYLSALVRPMADLPGADPAIRAELEALDDPHARLAEVDPDTAKTLHPNDRVRIVRALEVQRITGRPLSEVHRDGPGRAPLHAEVAWMDRIDLRGRIDRRLQRMAEQGYVQETEALLAQWGAGHKPMLSFAYRHLVEHVQCTLDLEEALRRTARDTWRMARKQRTWSRSMGWTVTDPDEVWPMAERVFSHIQT